jgi:hypothetical protein
MSTGLPALQDALEETAAVGHSLVRDALPPRRIKDLLDEVASGRFAPLESRVGTVDQRGEAFALKPDENAFPFCAELVSALAAEVRGSGVPGTAEYSPNEVTCQRYRDARSGIGPHMDQSRYRLIVAVFTLVGDARFSVFEDRSAATVVRAWTTRRGDLCLLRAPGLAGHADGRPTHSVGGPTTGARVSLSARMNTSGLDAARAISEAERRQP